MPTNDFLPFATAGGANVTAQATYAALAARLTGFQSGVAQSDQVNKAIRQAAFISSCLAQFVSNNSAQDTLDDADQAGFLAKMLRAWQAVGRIRLTGPLNIYVATTGNDATNTGLTVGSPLLTLQAAVNLVAFRYDLNGQTVTINVANGTYTQGVGVYGPMLGQLGPIKFIGNPGSPGSVVVNNGINAAAVLADFGAYVSVSGITITATGTPGLYAPTGIGMYAAYGGAMTFDHMVFGSCTYAHIIVDQAGQISSLGAAYTISAAAPSHAMALHAGSIVLNSSAITLTGTLGFSATQAFANANIGGSIDFTSCTFLSGSATGARYNVNCAGVVLTGGGGASFLPGNTTIAPTNGGVYA